MPSKRDRLIACLLLGFGLFVSAMAGMYVMQATNFAYKGIGQVIYLICAAPFVFWFFRYLAKKIPTN